MSEEAPILFSSTLPVIILTRPADTKDIDWQEVDRGPGYFTIPAGQEVRVRIKSINDYELGVLVKEIQPVEALRFLDLSENRNITNDGLERIKVLRQLTGLNLSSCTITSAGVAHLTELRHLEYLNLSFCNRLTDYALKYIAAIKNLTYIDLQGCLGLTHSGLARMRKRNLTVYR